VWADAIDATAATVTAPTWPASARFARPVAGRPTMQDEGDRAPRAPALKVVMLAVDLIAWTQHMLLHGELAKAEPKTLRSDCCTSPPGSTGDNAGVGCASNARVAALPVQLG